MVHIPAVGLHKPLNPKTAVESPTRVFIPISAPQGWVKTSLTATAPQHQMGGHNALILNVLSRQLRFLG
jgi:hypothetical protein